MKNLSSVGVILFFLALAASARGNPYLAKPGETPATVRVAACAITGGFIHLYAALDYGLFDKYGMKVEFVSIRGSGVALAALAADEIQFLYCAADATIPGMAAGSKTLVSICSQLQPSMNAASSNERGIVWK